MLEIPNERQKKVCASRDCEVNFWTLSGLFFGLVLLLLGTTAEEIEIPNYTIQLTLASIMEKIDG